MERVCDDAIEGAPRFAELSVDIETVIFNLIRASILKVLAFRGKETLSVNSRHPLRLLCAIHSRMQMVVGEQVEVIR